MQSAPSGKHVSQYPCALLIFEALEHHSSLTISNFASKLSACCSYVFRFGKYDHELGSTQNLPVQCHFWTIHVGPMGALLVQCFGCCIDVVHLLQWISQSKRYLQKVCMVNLKLVWT